MVTLAPEATLPRHEIGAAPRTGRSARGVWHEAWRRFRRHKLAMAGLVCLCLLAAVAIAAPLLSPHNPVVADVRAAGTYRQAAWIDDPNPMRSGTWAYPLGTDAIGRDVLSRLVYGTRVSLLVGLIPTILILFIGVPAGFAAGYAGGRVDTLIMRLADVVYAFPALLFFIVVQVSLADSAVGDLWNGLVLLFLTLSVLSWSSIARLARTETLALKELEFVVAARAGGAGAGRIVGRHILPNAVGPIVVAAAFLAPGGIIAEAILSYLGIGIRPDVRVEAALPASWGMMIFDGARAWQSQPWMLVAPTVAIALVTLAFTAVGDGLRNALDPQSGERR